MASIFPELRVEPSGALSPIGDGATPADGVIRHRSTSRRNIASRLAAPRRPRSQSIMALAYWMGTASSVISPSPSWRLPIERPCAAK